MKRFFLMIALAVMCFSLGACGAKKTEVKEEAGFKPQLDTKTACEIKVTGNYNNFEALEAAFDNFNQIYPNVVLSYVKLDDYNNIIGTALESNDAPNIYITYSWMYGKDTYKACLDHAEDLSDEKLGLNIDGIRPGLISRGSSGKVDMLPVFATTQGMLVNDDLFKKEGLKVPQTYPELLNVCRELKEKGYTSPVMCYPGDAKSSNISAFGLPIFCGTIYQNPEAMEKIIRSDPEAVEYVRPALERLQELIGNDYLNLEECRKMTDHYNSVILRFFEGDVPMMICFGDTVSGTRKRESQSEAFVANPFSYSFAPIPADETGAYFYDTTNVQFSVNKNCENLEMTNEFMRFLMSGQELNKLAQIKRLLTVTKDLTFDSVYSPFASIPESRIISEEGIQMKDEVVVRLREALYAVWCEGMSVDEAALKFVSQDAR